MDTSNPQTFAQRLQREHWRFRMIAFSEMIFWSSWALYLGGKTAFSLGSDCIDVIASIFFPLGMVSATIMMLGFTIQKVQPKFLRIWAAQTMFFMHAVAWAIIFTVLFLGKDTSSGWGTLAVFVLILLYKAVQVWLMWRFYNLKKGEAEGLAETGATV